MAGCFGNNSYDRYLEGELDRYLSQYDEEDKQCECCLSKDVEVIDEEEYEVVKIEGEKHYLDDLHTDDNDYHICPECELPFDVSDLD